jgi:hypothetical protein
VRLASTDIGAECATTFFTATTLCLTLLALTLYGRLLVKTTTLELFVDTLVGYFSLERFDGALYVISVYNHLEGCES